MLLMLVCTLPRLAGAQALPDAGSLLRNQSQPLHPAEAAASVLRLPDTADEGVAASTGGVRVRVSGFRFQGPGPVDEAALQALLADLLGRELSLAELQAAAARISSHYRQQGLLLARAYLPAQDIGDGVVTIALSPGLLAGVELDNQTRLPDLLLQTPLRALKTGEALRAADLERALLLIRQLAGAQAQASLAPGRTPGSTVLHVRVEPQSDAPTQLSLDNHGGRYTGPWRAGVARSWAMPLGLGDTLALRASTAGAGFRFGSLAYQAPWGAEGARLGISLSALYYRLGREFDALRARGSALASGVSLSVPLQLSRSATVAVQAGLERRRLSDSAEATGSRSDKTLDTLSLGLQGEARQQQAGRASSWSLGLVGGRAATSFARVTAAASQHWMPLPALPALQLAAQSSAQLSLGQRNLDAAEKLSLGGPQAVRAYAQGEAACDEAVLASLEARLQLPPGWEATAFVDAGTGRPMARMPAASDAAPSNRRRLGGAGLSVQGAGPRGLQWQLSLAWPLGERPRAEPERRPRLWATLQYGL